MPTDEIRDPLIVVVREMVAIRVLLQMAMAQALAQRPADVGMSDDVLTSDINQYLVAHIVGPGVRPFGRSANSVRIMLA